MESILKIVETVLYRLFELFHVEIEQNKLEVILQFFKFCVVGVTNTLLSYGLNVLALLLMEPLSFRWDYVVANCVAFFLSVLWSFYWNNKFVFHKERKQRTVWKTLLKTYVSYSFTGLILNNALSVLFIQYVGISKYIMPLINLFISVPVNFIINKYWAFKSD